MKAPAWHALPGAPAPGTGICARDAIADGTAKQFVLGADPPFRLLLLRSGERVHAYVDRCAHFGVPLSEKPEHLRYVPHVSISCNVHYARYRWEDGYCEAGDCKGESLIAVPVSVDAAGRICIAAGA